MTLTYLQTVPILRSFDEAKAREFYIDWLGFTVDLGASVRARNAALHAGEPGWHRAAYLRAPW
ncbi:MAG: hypothetical protein JNK01_04985 [Devosia sp.]|nr:hypothetical protein [Devosia sp.]